MPVYRLSERLVFPPPELGPRRGPIAVGGDLRPERLLLAYSMGIFPWQGDPLHWHSPDPRLVLLADELHMRESDIDEDVEFVDLGLDSISGVTWLRK